MDRITISRREASTLIRLLGILQDHLESAIASSTLPDGTICERDDESVKREVAKDRRDWRAAERLVAALDELRRKR